MMSLRDRLPRLRRVLFGKIPPPASLLRNPKRRHTAFAEQGVALFVGQPLLAARDAALTAYFLLRRVEGSLLSFAPHPPPGLDARTSADDLVSMLRRSLEAPGTARGSR